MTCNVFGGTLNGKTLFYYYYTTTATTCIEISVIGTVY